jgi:hypothetical protein
VITEYRVLGGLGICGGILAHVAAFNCWVFGAPRPLTITLWAAATLVLTFGCTNYVRGKGFNPLIGLTALIAPLGLVLVSVLPDRCPQEPNEGMREAHEAAQRQKNERRRNG